MNITVIINAAVALIAAIVSTFLIPWIKSKTTAQQREELVAWVKIAVSAAEQIYKGSGRGADKKQYVLDFLANNGFTVDTDSVNAAIEAAVKQLNSEGIIIS
ncbi:MAG: holin [Ruminococcaceae bacterium]|nr:holin [Oscillospiraceae bacterium]